jgi:hypothetical protein
MGKTIVFLGQSLGRGEVSVPFLDAKHRNSKGRNAAIKFQTHWPVDPNDFPFFFFATRVLSRGIRDKVICNCMPCRVLFEGWSILRLGCTGEYYVERVKEKKV